MIKGTTLAYSPGEAIKIKHRTVELSEEWAKLIGQPEWGEIWFVWGMSASGKSSFAMQLAKELCRINKVLYVSLEEGVCKTFTDRLSLFGMEKFEKRFRVITTSEIATLRERLRRQRSEKFVIVDSIQKANWSRKALDSLLHEFDKVNWIFISQTDQRGAPSTKTAMSLRFDAGVKLRTEGYRAYCEGRYNSDKKHYMVIYPTGEAEYWAGM